MTDNGEGKMLVLGFESEERLKNGESHKCDGCGRKIVTEPNMSMNPSEADFVVCPVCGQQAIESERGVGA